MILPGCRTIVYNSRVEICRQFGSLELVSVIFLVIVGKWFSYLLDAYSHSPKFSRKPSVVMLMVVVAVAVLASVLLEVVMNELVVAVALAVVVMMEVVVVVAVAVVVVVTKVVVMVAVTVMVGV